MIDITRETLISMSEAAGRVPSFRPGKKTHVATIFRWAQHGVRGVRLESIRFGGRLVTSVEALSRFVEALSNAPGDAPAPSPAPAARRHAEAVAAELTRLRI
jgi:hypothetical protein